MKLSRYQVAVVGGAACTAIATVMALMGGCTPQPVLTDAKPAAVESNAASGNLTLALDSLRKLAEGNDSQPAQRTIFYLNQWISSDVKASADWQPDRLSPPTVLD